MTPTFPEANDQFLARMLIAHREGDQINGEDARHLQELADFGRINTGHQTTSTLPEERRDASQLPSEV